MDDKIWQEFFCNDCNGHFRVKINMALNTRVNVVCPNCGRKHPRLIKDGRIEDSGYGEPTENIHTTKSSYSKDSIHKKMAKNARNGEVINEESDLKRDPYLNELWINFHGGKD